VSKLPSDECSFPLTPFSEPLLPLLPLFCCCFFGDSEVNEGMPVVVVLNLRGKITSCNYRGERERNLLQNHYVREENHLFLPKHHHLDREAVHVADHFE
jgi:hypothetical protein